MKDRPSESWLLLDTHVHFEAYRALSEGGIRAVHVGEEGIAAASAQTLLELAIEDDCIVVTGKYADFARLAEAYGRDGRSFPGILFLPADPERADPVSQAAAIERWVEMTRRQEEADDPGVSIRSRCEWLG